MKDSNGYAPSLFNTEDGVCYVTGIRGHTARHEIFGAANRDKSKEDGLWIHISPAAHDYLHSHKQEMAWLQMKAEALWLADDWSRTVQDFYNRYLKNYIGE